MGTGLLSFVGDFCGGALGLKIPGEKIIHPGVLRKRLIHFGLLSFFGVYTVKALLALIKSSLEEQY